MNNKTTLTFQWVMLTTTRLVFISSLCLMLGSCGNKSALFLESSEPAEKSESNKLNKIQVKKVHSEEKSTAKGKPAP